jgi:hypothetical protein
VFVLNFAGNALGVSCLVTIVRALAKGCQAAAAAGRGGAAEGEEGQWWKGDEQVLRLDFSGCKVGRRISDAEIAAFEKTYAHTADAHDGACVHTAGAEGGAGQEQSREREGALPCKASPHDTRANTHTSQQQCRRATTAVAKHSKEGKKGKEGKEEASEADCNEGKQEASEAACAPRFGARMCDEKLGAEVAELGKAVLC